MTSNQGDQALTLTLALALTSLILVTLDVSMPSTRWLNTEAPVNIPRMLLTL